MSAKRYGSAVAAAAIGIAAVAIGGCGTGERGTTGAAKTPVPITTPAQAVSFAHAVNLQPADLPDLRVSQPEAPSKLGPHEGAFAHCVGETDPRRAVARIHSATSKYPEGVGQLRSSVVVQPSETVALHNYRAALQPHLLTCLKDLLPAVLTGRATRAIRYGPVSATRLAGLAVPASTGVEIRTSVIVSTLPNPVPVYVDELGFVDGPAEVGLLIEAAPRPLPPGAEQRLLSLLYNRAKHRGV